MKKAFLVLLAQVFATGVCFAADVPQRIIGNGSNNVAQNGSATSAGELYGKVKKPTTPSELLANVKFAADHHLLLQDDFYKDENLLSLLGGSRIRRLHPPEPNETSNVIHLVDNPGVFVMWHKKDQEGQLGKISAIVEISGLVLGSRIDKEMIFKVFGNEWEISHPYQTAWAPKWEPPAPGQKYPDHPPHSWPIDTRRHETDAYKHTISTNISDETVFFTLSREGNVLYLRLVENEK